MTQDPTTQAFYLMAAAKGALELAEEALSVFGEHAAAASRPGMGEVSVHGRRMRVLADERANRRGIIGAQAFLSNLVVVEKCMARLSTLSGISSEGQNRAKRAVVGIQAVVHRGVRNSNEHIDDRLASATDVDGMVFSTILDDDLFCSSLPDGSLGSISVNRETYEAVVRAVNDAIWLDVRPAPQSDANFP